MQRPAPSTRGLEHDMSMMTDTKRLERGTGVAHAFADLRARYARYQTYRRTLVELGRLSNRELTDLGIGRGQIRGIAYETAYGL